MGSLPSLQRASAATLTNHFSFYGVLAEKVTCLVKRTSPYRQR